MAALQAPDRARRTAAPHRVTEPARRPALRVVSTDKRRTTSIRLMVVLSVCLVLGSMLGVVATQVSLLEGQVRLAGLQNQLATQTTRQRSLELQVAQLENPSRIVSQAEQQGLTAPTQLGDLQPVNLAPSSPPTTTPAPRTSGASGGAK
jgi:cell division protein FtsL